MVHWGWLLISFFGGVVFGMFVIAFCAVARNEDKNKKWWEE